MTLRFMPHWHRTWELVVDSDSDYAIDKEARRSVYGNFEDFLVYSLYGEAKG